MRLKLEHYFGSVGFYRAHGDIEGCRDLFVAVSESEHPDDFDLSRWQRYDAVGADRDRAFLLARELIRRDGGCVRQVAGLLGEVFLAGEFNVGLETMNVF